MQPNSNRQQGKQVLVLAYKCHPIKLKINRQQEANCTEIMDASIQYQDTMQTFTNILKNCFQ